MFLLCNNCNLEEATSYDLINEFMQYLVELQQKVQVPQEIKAAMEKLEADIEKQDRDILSIAVRLNMILRVNTKMTVIDLNDRVILLQK